MIISYVVFENEDDAIRFHQELVDPVTKELTGYGILAGSYKLPTRFCDEEHPFYHKRDGWTQLQKRGWWVCPICKRPGKPNPEVASFKLSNYGFDIKDKIMKANIGDVL